MSEPQITPDDLLDYVCGDLDASRRVMIERALEGDPARAAEVAGLTRTYEALRAEQIVLTAEFNRRLRTRWVDEDRDVRDGRSAEADPDEMTLKRTINAITSEDIEVSPQFNARLHSRLTEEWGDLNLLETGTVPANRATAGKTSPAAPASRRPEPASVGAPPGLLTNRLFKRVSIGLAASLVLAAATLWLSVTFVHPTPVHGLSDLRARLQHAFSLHIRGWRHEATEGEQKARIPLEWYIERPGRYRFNSGTANEGHTIMCDGTRWILVNRDRRVVAIDASPEVGFAAELTVEHLMQSGLLNELIGPVSRKYRKLESETVSGVRCNVYESIQTYSRRMVWLNAATGLPVRSVSYRRTESGPERISQVWDEIRADVATPKDYFSFRMPEGFEIIEPESRGAESVFTAALHTEHRHVVIRFAFNIHDRAILVCWAQYLEDSDPRAAPPLEGLVKEQQLRATAQSSSGSDALRHQLIRVDPGAGHDWNWSLMTPPAGASIDGDETYQFTFNLHENDYLLIIATGIFEFDRAKLADWIDRAQTLTLPADARPDSAITLESIEAMLAARRP